MACPSSDDDDLPGIILPSDGDSDDNLQVTPLMVAAYHGNVEKVLSLLQEDDQSIFARNISGQTAMSYAIDKDRMKVIDLLLAYEADIDEVDSSGGSMLHSCVHHGSISKVETCLKIGVNMDSIDRNGDTPLIVAAKDGLEDIVRLLISSGCDISTKNREGLDALEQSFCSNHAGIQSILSDASETDINDSWQVEMLQACEDGNERQVRHFIQIFGTKVINFRHQRFHCQTPLLVASRYGYLSCCEILRESGAYVDTPDASLDTPMFEATSHNNLEIVRWLVSQGARINRRNYKNQTALHYAVIEGNLAIVKYLVENGSLLHHRMLGGYTALHLATTKQHLDMLEYLLQQGAMVDARKRNGVTPLLQALDHQNIDMVRSLLKHGASVNKQDYLFNSPLSVAVSKNNIHLVTYLIENGADVNAATQHGISLTELALLQGYGDIVSVLRNVQSNTSERLSVLSLKLESVTAQTELFKICSTGQGSHKQVCELLRAGANVNATDNFGKTPLIVAAQNNCQQCVQWLLQESANIFIMDKKSYTALGYAVINGNVDIVQLLLQKVGSVDKGSENIQHELERSLNLCITEKLHANVEIMKMLLEHDSYTGSKKRRTLELLVQSITAENVDIVELLFDYQLKHDSFEPGVVTIACQSLNLDILQHLSTFVYKSEHQSAYIKCVIRFCLANRLDEALHIFACKPIKIQDIVWSSPKDLWFCSNNVVFGTATEMAVKHGLNIDTQNKAGCTYLMVAASKGMYDVVEYLLKRKGIKSDVTRNREDAFNMALDAGHYKTATLFSEEPLVVTDVRDKSMTDCNMMNSNIGKQRFNIGDLFEGLKSLIYDAIVENLLRKPESSVCLVKRPSDESSIVVHTTEGNQSTAIDHIFDVPFRECFNVEYVHNCNRASSLTIPSSNNKNVERKDYYTFSTFLSPAVIMDIFRQTDATVLQSGILKQQRMLWLITNDILEHLPHSHVTTDHEHETASWRCQVFTVRQLTKRKSVNVTVFMVPHETLLAIVPKKHCLNYVYCGPDEAMMHRNVVKMGLKAARSEGKIVDVNISFHDQQGQFYHGAFAVVSTEQRNFVKESECSDIMSTSLATENRQHFALPGNNGAAVVDKQSGIVLGFVVATLDGYDSVFKHVTFCLRLNNALDSLNELFNLGIGAFRTFES